MVLPYFPLRWGVLGVWDWGSGCANRVILPPALRGYNCRPEKYPFCFGTCEARTLIYVAKWTCRLCVHVLDQRGCPVERDVEMITHLHEDYRSCVLLEGGGGCFIPGNLITGEYIYELVENVAIYFLANIFYFMSVISKCFPIGPGVCVNE